MKKHTLRATRDYAMFSDHRNQQPMPNKHINRLAESMKKNGFFPSKPISFYRDPESMGRNGKDNQRGQAASNGINKDDRIL